MDCSTNRLLKPLTPDQHEKVVGMIKDLVVHVERLTILADFHVLDMVSDTTCPLLVGRGFLATAHD